MARILLIDEETSTRLVMQSRLREAGYEVVAADNGAQGLHLARDQAFDLFVIDAELSAGITSLEVCRRLANAPQTGATPVVLVSKQSSREDLARGYEAGCSAYLVKSDSPILDHVLRVLLRHKVELAELRRQVRSVEEVNRRLVEERQRAIESDHGPGSGGDSAQAVRELAVSRPDGLVVVDHYGVVRYADRGARELLGAHLEGKNLGLLAPATGLEAFVRDAHGDKRDGFRFDLPARNGRGARSLSASAVPLVSNPGEADPGLRVVVLLDTSRRKVATELMRLQEYTLPTREVGVLLDAARLAYATSSLVGSSEAMARIRLQVGEAIRSHDPVLLVGEAGAGRQHLARVIHFGGGSGGPFLPIHCAGHTAEHLEVELFGQVKGASSEATFDRPGAFQQAAQGTVYLADVEKLPPRLQAKLLRALREGVVERAGSDRPEPVEVRVIAATSANLAECVTSGAFDSELCELLSAVRIDVPPLRERREDVPHLARHFLKLFGSARGAVDLTPAAIEHLERYGWADNVRELERCIDRACHSAGSGPIDAGDLTALLRDVPGDPSGPAYTLPRPAREPALPARTAQGAARVPLATVNANSVQSDPDSISFAHAEKSVILLALEVTGGDKIGAARLLKVGKSTLYRKLKKHGIA